MNLMPVVSAVRPDPVADPAASHTLFASLYAELHRMARREVARANGIASIGATTLVHEAYLDMSARERVVFPDQFHFLAYASRAMRGLVIDHLRRRRAQKHGGAFEITALDTAIAERVADGHDAEELQEISDALDELAGVEPALAEVVDLKFFCGFSFMEIAALLSVSERTVQRHWEKARLYLHRAMSGSVAEASKRPFLLKGQPCQ